MNNIPSSTKTIVGFGLEQEPVTLKAVAPQRPQRTMVGVGPDQVSAIRAFLAPSSTRVPESRDAIAPPSSGEPTGIASRTLVGISPASEPDPASVRVPAPVSARADMPACNAIAHPTSMGPNAIAAAMGSTSAPEPLPNSFPAARVSLVSATPSSVPSIADLPFERPMLAAVGVAAAVAVWAFMMLIMFGV